MPKSRFAMYAPFLALALVQALFVALFPSTGADRSVSASGFDSGEFGSGPSDFGDGTFGDTDLDGTPTTTVDADGDGQPDPVATGAGTGSSGNGASGGQAGPTSPGAGGRENPVIGEGDTSHCAGDRQMNVFAVDFENPVCKPKFPDGADNGGATWTGVTADSIKVIIIEPTPNEQVDAVLKSQGLASSAEDRDKVNKAAAGFINKYYETYGRTITFERFVARCPSPADVPSCVADARKVIEMKPFAVFFNQPTYPELFEEFTRAGIISIGGWHFDKELFAGRRPFRWDVFIDGTDSARFIAEYYCKKLQGKNASNSGAVIHPQIGGRGQVPRKLGVISPDRQANTTTANLVKQLVQECGGQAVTDTYPPDINRSQSEATRITSKLISEGVTTVVCMCDPVFPVFLTTQNTGASYFPEHLMPGLGLLDADQVGRLYSDEQWIHAFGPSHLADTRPFADEQVSRVFADQGMGTPCSSCNLTWVYYSLLASMVHNAGPNLNPGTVEAGLFALGGTRGSGQTIGLGYGPGDYAAIDDIREAYWVPTAISQVDGREGSYRSIDSGKRYVLGELTKEFKVPVQG